MIDVTAGEHPPAAAGSLRILASISTAHFISHYHMLVLPMLFPFLKDALQVDYLDLGLALTVFGAVTGLTQAPVGYLVDRLGACKILVLGLCLGGAALIMLALTMSYGWFLACAALLGLANSVYHPADYALLAAHTPEARIGRAFSVHTFAGYLGAAVAPAVVAMLLTGIGGGGALVISGMLGIAVGALLIAMRIPEAGPTRTARDAGAGAGPARLLTPMVLVLIVFFILLGVSTTAMSNFGVVALMNGYDQPLTLANMTLTSFLGAAAVGVLAGGWLADRTARHEQVASACYAAGALIVGVIALSRPDTALLIVTLTLAGFLTGILAPSRDIMVRDAAPPGANGRVFGIVWTGFNIGCVVSPPLFGWLMDQTAPRWVLGAAAIFMLLTAALTLYGSGAPLGARRDVRL
jgi:MFS family permease